jgi:hypothetical protein
MATVKFNWKETKPDTSTMVSRFRHFLEVTDPKYYIVPNKEIKESVDTCLHYKSLSEAAPDGQIDITDEEKQKIMKGVKVMNSSTNDVG